ncbi:hypothetical protein ACHAXT_012716 [Thalassiosira profunda]
MSQSMQCLLGQEHEHLVSNVREDRLGCPTDVPIGDPKYCSNVTKVVERWNEIAKGMQQQDVLVVNTGAHWFGNPDERQTAFRNIPQAIAAVFNGTVIARTTVMGHDHCEEYLEPTSEFIDEDPGQKNRLVPYNWANFTHLNGLVHEAFLAAGMTGNLTLAREKQEGGAMDCLHYCVPGPIHIWNELLSHVLETILADELST